MSTEIVKSILQATQEAGRRARAAAGTGPCESCGAQPASPYAFAYARGVPPPKGSEGRYFDRVGASIVHLCAQCVEAEKRQLMKRRGKNSMISGIVFVAAIALAFLFGHGDMALPLAVGGVIVTGVLYGFRWSVTQDPRITGNSKACHLHSEGLRRQGFTDFWSDPSQV